ncbi:MAG: TonB-dependent receptor [Candidatus Marinimicrobia bacterium]|nr:TonB-dependent receptor [Candidatus Neomarinimicrobiota bacterium]
MKFKFIAIVILCLIFTSPLIGQSSISGIVVDSLNKQPLQYSNIVLYEQDNWKQVDGTVTDSTGRFLLTEIPNGVYNLKVDYMGFETDTIKINIGKNDQQVQMGRIALKRITLSGEGVEVTAENISMDYQIDKKVINVNRQQSSISGSAVDILRNAPSITTDSEGNVQLRGSSSFKVLVNGKPTPLDGNQALQHIPATRIQSIEIITNPSAKYDPSGEAGIINIILKKERRKGLNGMVNLSGGSYKRYSGEALLNYRKEKFNATLDMSYESEPHPGSGERWNTTMAGDTITKIHSYGEREEDEIDYNISGTIKYLPDTNNTFSLDISTGYRSDKDSSRGTFQRTTIIESGNSLDTLHSNNYKDIEDGTRSGRFNSVNLSYTHDYEKEGHKLEGYLDFSTRDGDSKEIQKQIDNGVVNYGEKNIEGGPSKGLELKIDYTLPFSQEKELEAGLQSRIRDATETNERYIYNYGSNQFNSQPKVKREMNYTRNIHGIYATYSSKYSGFGYQLGLRAEHTHRNIESDTTLKISRLDIFPTLHTSYSITEKQELMASYSRRIRRPRSWFMEPFEQWQDQYNVRRGNPDLIPQYIDSYSFGYNRNFGRNLFSFETYYRVTHNKIDRVQSPYRNKSNVILHTIDNIGKDFDLGAEIMLNLNLYNWWNLNLSGNLYQYRIEGSGEYDNIERESFNWTTRLNSTFNIGNNARLQINQFYNSPSISTQGEREAFYATNASLRMDFLQKTLTGILQVRDIFDTGQWEFESSGEGFSTRGRFSRAAPTVTLTLRYNINNYRRERRREQQPGRALEEGEGEGGQGRF